MERKTLKQLLKPPSLYNSENENGMKELSFGTRCFIRRKVDNEIQMSKCTDIRC